MAQVTNERLSDLIRYHEMPHSCLSINCGECDMLTALRELQQARARIAELERDLAAAREDAERYRFWRMRVHFAMSMGRRELAFCLTKDYGPAQHEEHGRQVDAAIDAARSK